MTWPSYLQRRDLTLERVFARQLFATCDLREMFAWIQAATSPSDVFLAREDLSLSVIATAGRKVVAVERLFSNPFVNWESRARDRDTMMAALTSGDPAHFHDTATRHRVRYVVTEARIDRPERFALAPVWDAGPWQIYRYGSRE